MGLAGNMKEVKKILQDRVVILNGVPCTDPKMGIGVFDIISIPKIDKYFRILRDKKGDYVSIPISAENAKSRLCKISDKTVVKGGKIQLNILDKPGQVANKVLGHFPFKEGNVVMIIGGSHSGKVGRILKIDVIPGSTPNRVYLKDEKTGVEFDTIEEYTFVVGTTESAVKEWGIEG